MDDCEVVKVQIEWMRRRNVVRRMTLEFQKIEDVLEAIKAAEKLELYYSVEKKYEGAFYGDVWSLKIECWCEGSSEDERADQGVQD